MSALLFYRSRRGVLCFFLYCIRGKINNLYNLIRIRSAAKMTHKDMPLSLDNLCALPRANAKILLHAEMKSHVRIYIHEHARVDENFLLAQLYKTSLYNNVKARKAIQLT